MHKVENITPYRDGSKREQVREMFDTIAPAYDFMNHAMTLGIDRRWRRTAVKRLKALRPSRILDLATGTGDFAIDLYRRLRPAKGIAGLDLSQGMLDIAAEKAKRLDLNGKITFTQGDCLDLPFPDGSFDAVTVAFGVRNFEDIEKGYREMYRVMSGGATVVVLELSVPRNAFVRWFYNLYAMHIIPFIGGMKSGDREAYRYLPRSIAAAPQGEAMLEIMRAAGFKNCTARTLTLGSCTLYQATK